MRKIALPCYSLRWRLRPMRKARTHSLTLLELAVAMKQVNWALLLLFLLLFSVFGVSTMQAQTTYTVAYPLNAATVADGNAVAMNVQFKGTGNAISWVTGGGNWACSAPGGGPSGAGFIYATLSAVPQPCSNAVSYADSGSFPSGVCKGMPTMGTWVFNNNWVLTFSYTWTFYRGCRGWITGGTLVVPN